MTSLKYSQSSQLNQQKHIQSTDSNSFTNQLLFRLQKYNQERQITLEQSIPILYELNIFQELTSIPQAKRRLTQNTKPNQRLQLQARFIYNLWKLIEQQTIPMRAFKQIITLFIVEQTSNLASKLDEVFQNQHQTIIELLAIWEGMLQNRTNKGQFSHNLSVNSALIQQQASINSLNMPSNQDQKKNHFNKNELQRNNLSTNNRFDSNGNLQWNKQNARNYSSRDSHANSCQQNAFKSRRDQIDQIKNEIYNKNFYQIPSLTSEQQKELVSRLYVVNKYDKYRQIKKIQDEQKIIKEMQQCTFQPKIERENDQKQSLFKKNRLENSQKKTIPGYQKAISRMKVGQVKTKQLKEKLELRNISLKNTNKHQVLTKPIPPKFLNEERKKDEKKLLFTIQFDIGRHKLTCKICENDSAEQLAKNIQAIYSLKQQSYEQIKQIIDQQIKRFFNLSENGVEIKKDTEDKEGNQNVHLEEENHQSRQKQNTFVFC